MTDQDEKASAARAAAGLAQADAAQLRLSGTILAVLIKRGILTDGEATGIVEDTMAFLPDDHSHRPLYEKLISEFPD